MTKKRTVKKNVKKAAKKTTKKVSKKKVGSKTHKKSAKKSTKRKTPKAVTKTLTVEDLNPLLVLVNKLLDKIVKLETKVLEVLHPMFKNNEPVGFHGTMIPQDDNDQKDLFEPQLHETATQTKEAKVSLPIVYTKEDVTQSLRKVGSKFGLDKVKEILNQFEAKCLSDVEESSYSQFIEECEKHLT